MNSFSSLGKAVTESGRTGATSRTLSDILSCCFSKKSDQEEEQESLVGSFNGHQVEEEVISIAWDVKEEATKFLKQQTEEYNNFLGQQIKLKKIELEKNKVTNNTSADPSKEIAQEKLIEIANNHINKIKKYVHWATWRFNYLAADSTVKEKMHKEAPYMTTSWTPVEIWEDWRVTKDELTPVQISNELIPKDNSPESINEKSINKKKTVTFFDESEDHGISRIFRNVSSNEEDSSDEEDNWKGFKDVGER